jgi:hypothetical protein
MVGMDQERIAAEHAEKVIGMLSVSGGNPNLEAIIQTPRKAKDAATLSGATPTFSSEETLNSVRSEVDIALSGLICATIEKGPFTQQTIDRARRAVEDWKKNLAAA